MCCIVLVLLSNLDTLLWSHVDVTADRGLPKQVFIPSLGPTNSFKTYTTVLPTNYFTTGLTNSCVKNIRYHERKNKLSLCLLLICSLCREPADGRLRVDVRRTMAGPTQMMMRITLEVLECVPGPQHPSMHTGGVTLLIPGAC